MAAISQVPPCSPQEEETCWFWLFWNDRCSLESCNKSIIHMLKIEQLLFKDIFLWIYFLKKVLRKEGDLGSLVIFLTKENWGNNSSEEKAVQNDINQRCGCPVPMKSAHRILKSVFYPARQVTRYLPPLWWHFQLYSSLQIALWGRSILELTLCFSFQEFLLYPWRKKSCVSSWLWDWSLCYLVMYGPICWATQRASCVLSQVLFSSPPTSHPFATR
jgi:hypothetical protein